jgi:hypothetical protein
MKNPKVGRNDPCPCGSGKKLKKCHGAVVAHQMVSGVTAASASRPQGDLHMSGKRLRLFNEMKRQLVSDYQCCLWPFSKCKSAAIRAHSIQNRRVLDLLSTDGHVVMPRIHATPTQRPTVRFERVGRNEASTFTGLCARHDQELFRAIDTEPVDFENPKHGFLLAYRALLKEAHASRKAAIDVQAGYLAGAREGLWPRDAPSPAGEAAVVRMTAAFLVHQAEAQFGDALANAEWARLAHRVLLLGEGPTFAVSSMVSTGIYSEISDGPAFAYLNVLPFESRTVAILSFLVGDRVQAEKAFGTVWAADPQQAEYLLSQLVLRRCENLVISPRVFESFAEPQKQAIRTYYEWNTFGHEYETKDPRVTLFRAVV